MWGSEPGRGLGQRGAVPSRTNSIPGAGRPRRAALAWGEGPRPHSSIDRHPVWNSFTPLVDLGKTSLSAEGKLSLREGLS